MSKETRIGGLWLSRSTSEKAPHSKGSIELGGVKRQVVIWPNRWKKDGEKTPDFYIELDADIPPRERADAPAQARMETPEDGIPF